MNKANIKEKIREFILDQFVRGDASISLEDDDSLLDKRIIDSTGVLELTMFIEETFNIRVEDEELIPDNLDSINRLVMFIKNKSQNK